MKNVLHINHTTFGGPGRVVNTIYDALENVGYNNTFITVRGESTRKTVYLNKYHYYISRILSKVLLKLKTSPIDIEPEVFCFPKCGEILKKIGDSKVDIIILYWYKNTISSSSIAKLVKKTGAKLYVYLMDEGPFTGGCHYHLDCTNYIKGCGNCPSFLYGKFSKDITYINVKNDKKVFEQYNATVICPTTLSRLEADESFKFKNLKKEILLIPLSSDYLLKKNKNDYRKYLNVEGNGTYLFFGASHLENERKGMKFLVEALKKVYNELSPDERNNIKLLIAGDAGNFDFKSLNFDFKQLGYLDYNKLLAAYKASDFLLSPSVVDMGPMMVNEAVRSGLPVVCFNVGVSNDLVINEKTGYRVEVQNTGKLAEAILKSIRLSPSEREEMSSHCIDIGKQKLSEDSFTQKIKQIFENE